MKTIKFYTLGCKVNQYETQGVREQVLAAGFQEIANGSPADAYVINTCTVTARADSESLNLLRRARRENPKARIIVTGCLTEGDKARIKSIDTASLIVKNQDKGRIAGRLSGPVVVRQRPWQGISYFTGHTRAFLKIQDGCDNFCAYCKVPLVRPSLRSKPLKEIIREAGDLACHGYQEIVICGVCLGSYGRDLRHKPKITGVLSALEKIEGLARIRLSSIEPQDLPQELIGRIASSRRICHHLHLPLQSGDDAVLKAMNRKYDAGGYLSLIKRVKKSVPGIAITTDVIVGFPGESEKNFLNTLKILKMVRPLRTHIFPYSGRPGTAAYRMRGAADAITVKERCARLRKAAQDFSLAYRRKFLGKRMRVLIEGNYGGGKGVWQGYTDNYIPVVVEAERDLRNKLVTVRLSKIEYEGAVGNLLASGKVSL